MASMAARNERRFEFTQCAASQTKASEERMRVGVAPKIYTYVEGVQGERKVAVEAKTGSILPSPPVH